MKLVTFQSKEAIEFLEKNSFLVTDERFVNKTKSGKVYEWVIEKMNEKIVAPEGISYPLWCWVKCFRGICPPKRKGKHIADFYAKITFHKNPEDVFVTDFQKFSFILNNTYLPENLEEKAKFDSLLKEYNITQEELKAYMRKDKYDMVRNDEKYLQACEIIRKTFDRVISSDGKILQGCVWRIDKSDIEKIEILHDDGYAYGSLNYIRANGKRYDWINNYYKTLKK